MLEVINQILYQRKENHDVVLVGIMEGSGSLPRKKGAYMVVGKDGRLAGTVGGGNLEFQAIEFAKHFFSEGPVLKAGQGTFLPSDTTENFSLKPEVEYQMQTYELNSKDSAKLGMVCGGRARFLFYPIASEDTRFDRWLEAWKQAVLEGQDYVLRFYNLFRNTLPPESCEIIFEDRIPGDGIVYVFGAGHLAREVVPLLAHLNFRCIVLDDREEFARKHFFPEAQEVMLVNYRNLKEFIQPGKADYLVIMTRGHEWDMEAESFGLKTKAGYIGVVGSRKKTAFVNEKLKEQGFTEQDISRIITPIGLDIGSETPAEIAVSIAAQLIETRAKKHNKVRTEPVRV